MTPIHESRNEGNISPRTPLAPVWTASEWQELFSEPPRSLRRPSPSPSESLQALTKRHSDETIFDIYHAYEQNGVHRPQSGSSNRHQQRPSEATLVDGSSSFYGRGSRASSTTLMSIVKEYNASTRQIDKILERGKCLTEIPIFDATFAKIEWHYLSLDTREPELLAFPPENLRPPDLRRYSSPRGWSKIRKMLVTTMLSLVTSLAANAVGSYNCPMDILMGEWGVSEVAYEVGLTIFCLGLAIAPMVSAPLSEVTGRRAIFIASGLILASASVGCGFANSYAMMLVCRLFAGIGASTFASIVGGVIGDMYAPIERNTPMALFSANALLGIGLGPSSTMFIVAKFSWRWAFWLQAIAVGVAVILLFVFLPETRASVLLDAKAKILNKYYEKLERIGMWGVRVHPSPGNSETHTRIARLRFMTLDDEERESLGKMIAVSCYRPWHMLFTEPIVFLFSSWGAFAWAVLYIQFEAIPFVFKRVYHFNSFECGLVFGTICVGTLIGTITSILQEKLLRKCWPKKAKAAEGRLYWACIQSTLLPIGLFWFGWSSTASVTWWSPVIAIGVSSIGIYSTFLACHNFLTDAYHTYASSALAAQSGCRNILGGIFPLVTTAMFNKLGIAQAASLLGFIGGILGFVPWIFVFYGPAIRAKSNMATMGSPL